MLAHNKTLVKLGLSSNNLSQNNATQFEFALEKNKKLQFFDISNNQFQIKKEKAI